MVVAFYFRLHLAYFPRPVVAIFARPEQLAASKSVESKLTAKAAPSNLYELIEEITEQCLHRQCSVIFIICLHIR